MKKYIFYISLYLIQIFLVDSQAANYFRKIPCIVNPNELRVDLNKKIDIIDLYSLRNKILKQEKNDNHTVDTDFLNNYDSSYLYKEYLYSNRFEKVVEGQSSTIRKRNLFLNSEININYPMVQRRLYECMNTCGIDNEFSFLNNEMKMKKCEKLLKAGMKKTYGSSNQWSSGEYEDLFNHPSNFSFDIFDQIDDFSNMEERAQLILDSISNFSPVIDGNNNPISLTNPYRRRQSKKNVILYHDTSIDKFETINSIKKNIESLKMKLAKQKSQIGLKEITRKATKETLKELKRLEVYYNLLVDDELDRYEILTENDILSDLHLGVKRTKDYSDINDFLNKYKSPIILENKAFVFSKQKIPSSGIDIIKENVAESESSKQKIRSSFEDYPTCDNRGIENKIYDHRHTFNNYVQKVVKPYLDKEKHFMNKINKYNNDDKYLYGSIMSLVRKVWPVIKTMDHIINLKKNFFKKYKPQPRYCCKAFIASCLACEQGITKEKYCKINPNTVGCCTKPELFDSPDTELFDSALREVDSSINATFSQLLQNSTELLDSIDLGASTNNNICPTPICKPPEGCKYEHSDEKNENCCPKHPCGILKCKVGFPCTNTQNCDNSFCSTEFIYNLIRKEEKNKFKHEMNVIKGKNVLNDYKIKKSMVNKKFFGGDFFKTFIGKDIIKLGNKYTAERYDFKDQLRLWYGIDISNGPVTSSKSPGSPYSFCNHIIDFIRQSGEVSSETIVDFAETIRCKDSKSEFFDNSIPTLPTLPPCISDGMTYENIVTICDLDTTGQKHNLFKTVLAVCSSKLDKCNYENQKIKNVNQFENINWNLKDWEHYFIQKKQMDCLIEHKNSIKDTDCKQEITNIEKELKYKEIHMNLMPEGGGGAFGLIWGLNADSPDVELVGDLPLRAETQMPSDITIGGGDDDFNTNFNTENVPRDPFTGVDPTVSPTNSLKGICMNKLDENNYCTRNIQCKNGLYCDLKLNKCKKTYIDLIYEKVPDEISNDMFPLEPPFMSKLQKNNQNNIHEDIFRFFYTNYGSKYFIKETVHDKQDNLKHGKYHFITNELIKDNGLEKMNTYTCKDMDRMDTITYLECKEVSNMALVYPEMRKNTKEKKSPNVKLEHISFPPKRSVPTNGFGGNVSIPIIPYGCFLDGKDMKYKFNINKKERLSHMKSDKMLKRYFNDISSIFGPPLEIGYLIVSNVIFSSSEVVFPLENDNNPFIEKAKSGDFTFITNRYSGLVDLFSTTKKVLNKQKKIEIKNPLHEESLYNFDSTFNIPIDKQYENTREQLINGKHTFEYNIPYSNPLFSTICKYKSFQSIENKQEKIKQDLMGITKLFKKTMTDKVKIKINGDTHYMKYCETDEQKNNNLLDVEKTYKQNVLIRHGGLSILDDMAVIYTGDKSKMQHIDYDNTDTNMLLLLDMCYGNYKNYDPFKKRLNMNVGKDYNPYDRKDELRNDFIPESRRQVRLCLQKIEKSIRKYKNIDIRQIITLSEKFLNENNVIRKSNIKSNIMNKVIKIDNTLDELFNENSITFSKKDFEYNYYNNVLLPGSTLSSKKNKFKWYNDDLSISNAHEDWCGNERGSETGKIDKRKPNEKIWWKNQNEKNYYQNNDKMATFCV